MRNPQLAKYSDAEIAESYLWIRQQAAAALLEGRDTEKYRDPLKELGDEVNARIEESLDEIEEILNTPPGQPA